LHRAAYNGNVKLIERLLVGGAQADAQDTKGVTPLQITISEGHFPATKALLKRKASPALADNKGNTPLHYAAEVENQEAISLLILTYHVSILTENIENHDACEEASSEAIKQLITNLAYIDQARFLSKISAPKKKLKRQVSA
jgi:ankyrin repeat protein